MEEVNNNLEQTQEVEETTQQQPEQTEQTEQQKTHSGNEENIRQLRQAKEKAEREREEYLQRLHQYEEQQKKSAENSYRDPSDLAEYKDLLELRKEMERHRAEQEQLSMEIKLRQNYPDIDSVLTAENIERFKKEEPELAAILNENKNMYTKASVIYKYLKKSNNTNDYQKEKDMIAANASKPRSSASISKDTPLSQVNDYMTDPEERRKMVYKQMLAAIRNG